MAWYNNYWGQLPLNISKLSNRKLAEFNNNQEFLNTFEALFTAAQNEFEWTGLPETCDERYLERSLILCGQAALVYKSGNYLTLAAAGGSDVTLYGYPANGYVYGLNGYNEEVRYYVPGADESMALRRSAGGAVASTNYNAVMGYDNRDAYPYVNYIIAAARRMADIMRSCDVVAQNLKQPIIITCNELDRRTVEQALNDKSGNVASIITSKSIALDSFKVWQTGANPVILDTLWTHYKRIEAQALSTLGVNCNDQYDKRERLIVDEVNSNNQQIAMMADKRLEQRQLFCDRVRDAFGLEISVRRREPAPEPGESVDGEPEDVEEDVENVD